MQSTITLEQLATLLQQTRWFKRLGQPFEASGDVIRIPSLEPWANVPTGDTALTQIADHMKWLPSSREQDDPIHGRSLEERSARMDQSANHSRRILDLYKTALASLRGFDGHPSLWVGPHDFTEAARGAALFAVRRAALELLVDEHGFWCSAMNLYRQGHWPCGILPNGVMVAL